ncbi:MAG: hypothetical protein KGS72_19395 [Cyanobacteria bacterium REEB67]|nr:hypothetical protein [Cyanobacteria bacterium REEB67]
MVHSTFLIVISVSTLITFSLICVFMKHYESRSPKDYALLQLKKSLRKEEKSLRKTLTRAEQERRANLPFDLRRSMLERDLHLIEISEVGSEDEMLELLAVAKGHYDRGMAAHELGFPITATTQHDLCFGARGKCIVASYPLCLKRRARLAKAV